MHPQAPRHQLLLIIHQQHQLVEHQHHKRCGQQPQPLLPPSLTVDQQYPSQHSEGMVNQAS